MTGPSGWVIRIEYAFSYIARQLYAEQLYAKQQIQIRSWQQVCTIATRDGFFLQK
jgi:hypothetical protein